MPLAADQGVGALVWSPLGWGRLTGKIRRDSRCRRLRVYIKPLQADPRCPTSISIRSSTLSTRSQETGRLFRRFALNWLAASPTVSTVVIGARDEKQLRANLESVGWKLTPEQVAKLDAASAVNPAYPYWHQVQFDERNPFPYRRLTDSNLLA